MTLYPQNAGDIAFASTLFVLAFLTIILIIVFGMTKVTLLVLVMNTIFGGILASKVEKFAISYFEKKRQCKSNLNEK